MSNISQIDQANVMFQNFIYSIIIRGNRVTQNDVYGYLKNYDVPQELAGQYLNQEYVDLINKNINLDKIKGAYSDMDIISFSTSDNFQKAGNKELNYEVNIPIKEDTYSAVMARIKTFLETKNIQSSVTISKKYCNSPMKIYLKKPEDVQLLVRFVNNNFGPMLKASHPFMPTFYGIGVVKNGNNQHSDSYNNVVSKYLSKYIDACIANNKVNEDYLNFDSFLASLQLALTNNKVQDPIEANILVGSLNSIKMDDLKYKQTIGHRTF